MLQARCSRTALWLPGRAGGIIGLAGLEDEIATMAEQQQAEEGLADIGQVRERHPVADIGGRDHLRAHRSHQLAELQQIDRDQEARDDEVLEAADVDILLRSCRFAGDEVEPARLFRCFFCAQPCRFFLFVR